MLFMQPVVVTDAPDVAVAAAAEVRMAEARAAVPTWTEWNGVVLAQSSLDQRSPFGANAVDNNNKVTPGAATTEPVTPTPSDNPDLPGSTAPATRTSAPPSPSQPEPAPPVTGSGTTTTAPPSAAPGTATPSSTPGGAGGSGNSSGTMSAPNNPVTPIPPPGPSSSTVPGATLGGGSSGASNSR
jgi:hypothetical protein